MKLSYLRLTGHLHTSVVDVDYRNPVTIIKMNNNITKFTFGHNLVFMPTVKVTLHISDGIIAESFLIALQQYPFTKNCARELLLPQGLSIIDLVTVSKNSENCFRIEMQTEWEHQHLRYFSHKFKWMW